MLTHQGTKTLRTNRLTLRRFTVEDANLMFENWANDTRVTRYLTWPAHTSPVFTKQLLESWCAEYEKPDFYNWAICLDNQPIGNISAVEISERDESAALGYCIGTGRSMTLPTRNTLSSYRPTKRYVLPRGSGWMPLPAGCSSAARED